MPTMLWNAYLKRRRITNVEKWLTLNKVYSYSELTQFLKEKYIIPPEEKEASLYFNGGVSTKPAAALKNGDGMSVDEEGFLVAEQVKKETKTTRRKRSSRSTRTSKKSAAKAE